MKSQIQQTHTEYFRSLNKKYKDLTAEELRIKSRLYMRQARIDNKERFDAYEKQYAIDNKERLTAAYKQRRIDNKEYFAAYAKQHHIDNKEYYAAWAKEYAKTDAYKLRIWIHRAMKRKGESKTTWIDNIGCTKEEFKAHIESQFVEGMCWDNWTTNGWHMDHIQPLSKGGSNHYTNIQPLWAKDNLAKGNKIL
tara:strand:- start:46 stop:627 length:582 start_codon:yes stop_codon:yes gene_type:complete